MFVSKPHIAQFELRNYFYLRDFVTSNQIPCDWKSVGAVCSLDTEEAAEAAKENVRLLRRHHPSLADKAIYVEKKEELKRLRVPNARAAVVHPNAAKVWPYKLVAWVLEDLLKVNHTKDPSTTGIRFNLQTTTPVTHLQRYGGSWVLHTPRGQVVAKQVLLATNGYTSHLLPKMTKLIIPTRGQIGALIPPKGATPLQHTHIWSPPSGADDYLVQRDDSGILILGGERAGATLPQSATSRDDVIDQDVARQLRRACRDALELRPGEGGGEADELEAVYEWTGIMGDSLDRSPWVGQVPESLGGGDGLYISAAYTGHGMPAASQCGIAVANIMMHGDTGDVDLPPEFLASEDRLKGIEKIALPQTWEEEIRMNAFWIQQGY